MQAEVRHSKRTDYCFIQRQRFLARLPIGVNIRLVDEAGRLLNDT